MSEHTPAAPPPGGEPLWYECGACHRRQSRHEKFPHCAYCNGRIWPVDDAPLAAFRGVLPELVSCPACDDDGNPCAVCKPDAYREAKEAEIAALTAQLAGAREEAARWREASYRLANALNQLRSGTVIGRGEGDWRICSRAGDRYELSYQTAVAAIQGVTLDGRLDDDIDEALASTARTTREGT